MDSPGAQATYWLRLTTCGRTSSQAWNLESQGDNQTTSRYTQASIRSGNFFPGQQPNRSVSDLAALPAQCVRACNDDPDADAAVGSIAFKSFHACLAIASPFVRRCTYFRRYIRGTNVLRRPRPYPLLPKAVQELKGGS